MKRLSPPSNLPVYVAVCRGCDTRADRWEKDAEEGKNLRKALVSALKPFERVQVIACGCLGGCESSVPEGKPNACCSVALMGEGRYTYVLNGLSEPDGIWKVQILLEEYLARDTGLLRLQGHPHARELGTHIATRTPPLPRVGAVGESRLRPCEFPANRADGGGDREAR